MGDRRVYADADGKFWQGSHPPGEGVTQIWPLPSAAETQDRVSEEPVEPVAEPAC